MRFISRVALGLLLVSVLPSAAGGQVVTGVLLEQGTETPIPGAFALLLNEDSLEVIRTLTDPLGRFTLHAPRAGRYRVRTEVVGFRAAVTAEFELQTRQTQELELRLESVFVRLGPVRVTGRRECRTIGEQALEVLAIWEETRKVLRAVQWTDQQEQLVHELERFQRTYTPSFTLLYENRSTTPTLHVMPFRSRSVEELDELGYVVIEGDSVVYEAPDAEIFFSEPFLESHCFWLDARSDRTGRKIGLRFEPVGDGEKPDVRGVFWIDEASGALENLEINYVNVGAWQRERGAGGELRFARLPDGRWFVEDWWIRMPLVLRGRTPRGLVWDFPETIAGFEEQGGEVVRVFDADGRTLYARGRAALRGTVYDSTAGRVLEGAHVRLVNTDRMTISEADGTYWLPDLPSGRYQVTFEHPRAKLLGWVDERTVRFRKGAEQKVSLALPPAAVIAGRMCAASEIVTAGYMVGTVSYADSDSTLAGARVRVVWNAEPAGNAPLRWTEVMTDDAGVYRVCVPRDASLSVEVITDAGTLVAVPTVFGAEAVMELDVEVRDGGTVERRDGGAD